MIGRGLPDRPPAHTRPWSNGDMVDRNMTDIITATASAADLVAALGPLPTPWNIEELCASLATERDRALILHPMNLPALPFGLWYDDGTRDNIVYRSTVTGFHRDHIILHEICHMLARHTQLPLRTSLDTGGRDVGLRPRERAAEINPYTARQEELAESFATIVLEKVFRLDAPPISDFEHRASTVFGSV
ncbi:hypothetical protein [Rhodococcus jostii]|uniref:hypothetical protein n=1 Tax=Rhodococcus jostii TaxID=132919 RepID=UPI0036270279